MKISYYVYLFVWEGTHVSQHSVRVNTCYNTFLGPWGSWGSRSGYRLGVSTLPWKDLAGPRLFCIQSSNIYGYMGWSLFFFQIGTSTAHPGWPQIYNVARMTDPGTPPSLLRADCRCEVPWLA